MLFAMRRVWPLLTGLLIVGLFLSLEMQPTRVVRASFTLVETGCW